MSELEKMTCDHWLGCFMMLSMLCMCVYVCKTYRGFMAAGDWTGVKVVRWSVVIGLFLLLIAFVFDVVGFIGIV